MKIAFTKMHGLGNDFVVINSLDHPVNLTSAKIQRMADRHRGIGFDQLLLIEPTQNMHADFNYRIFNSDGSEVSQCGNGARCLGRYIREFGLSDKKNVRVATHEDILEIEIITNDLITVRMGVPNFTPDKIPLNVAKAEAQYSVDFQNKTLTFGAVSIGNPHAVFRVDNIADIDVAEIGTFLQNHALFPQSVNVGFMQVKSPKNIALRVYERGAGETEACGSGACAAVAVGVKQGYLQEKVNVDLLGGALEVAWPSQKDSIYLTGPATTIYVGEWIDDDDNYLALD